MSRVVDSVRKKLRKPTLAETLVVIAIVVVLIALIFPTTKWVADGEMPFPVRVFVFDAGHGLPIAGAQVTIFHAFPMLNADQLKDDPRRFDPRPFARDFEPSAPTTGADGVVVIEHKFRTSASHNRPKPHAHLRWEWVFVHAEGYGSVVIPVRHDSVPVATVREQKELIVPIGLMK